MDEGQAKTGRKNMKHLELRATQNSSSLTSKNSLSMMNTFSSTVQ